MIEEEAKNKLCPHLVFNATFAAIKASEKGLSDAHIDKAMATSHCQASDCMMWQKGKNEHDKHGSHPAGYCGLAGK